jgi:Ca-activated chloride channel family protein
VGNGILVSLNTIVVDAGDPPFLSTDTTVAPTQPAPDALPQGWYPNAAIVLLTDGENNQEPDPIVVTDLAVDLGVRIYTVGIGKPEGAIITVEGFTVLSQLNEPILQYIAATTGGVYYNAGNEEQLNQIYSDLEPKLSIKTEEMEVTSLFAGAGMFLFIPGAFSFFGLDGCRHVVVLVVVTASYPRYRSLYLVCGGAAVAVLLSLSLVREAASHQSWLRKHLPFILFLFALTSLILALTRPTATVVVPSNRATIILAMDVSLSMCSTDIPPNRLQAAKEAALQFVETREPGTRIGVVAFAGFAELAQPPTDDRDLLNNAITFMSPARRTAIGSAILRSIDAIAEVDPGIAPVDLDLLAPVTPAAEYAPHIIVLLTDGSSNAGPSPFLAADQALARGIRVYTIGFGTLNNSSPMDCGSSIMESDPFSLPGFGQGMPFFGGGGGGGFRRELDEVTLKQIADMTGGTYYAATSAGELQTCFRTFPPTWWFRRRLNQRPVHCPRRARNRP